MGRRARRPDVFISYDRKSSAEETKKLARDLEAAGFSTWWDTQNMRAGDDFYEAIDKHLDLCKAAIIIWTPESTKSKWVRAEADHALRLDKLINTHVPGMDPARIPKPFNQVHSVDLADRAAIVDAVKVHLPARRRRKGGTALGLLDSQTRADSEPSPDPEPTPPGPAVSRPMLIGLGTLLVVGLAAVLYILTRTPVPEWSFDPTATFLGVKIPLAWKYEPPAPGKPVRFEIESGQDGDFSPQACTDAHHYYVGNVNAPRDWRVRAVTDCESRSSVSGWSEPISVTQYDSVYARIKATGQANVYVSNSQDQDVFKWGDQGFDIDLTRLILRDLSHRMGDDLTLVLHAVDWDRLLPEAGDGVADFAISSITRRPYREKEFKIEFSDPYFCTTHALVYRPEAIDAPIGEMVAGKIVGAQSNTTNYQLAELLSQDGMFKLEAFANTESIKNALRAGRIDFAVTDTSFAQSAQLDTRLPGGKEQLLYKEFGPQDMPTSGEVEVAQNYAIAVRRGEIQLLSAIDDALAKAKLDGELTDLFAAASKAYEEAHDYPPGNRSLGERPWECAGHVAERVDRSSPN